jgi:hypothetical protein
VRFSAEVIIAGLLALASAASLTGRGALVGTQQRGGALDGRLPEVGGPREPAVDRELFAGEHGGGFAFEVDVRLAADVDRDAIDGAAGELVGVGSGVV